MRGTKKQRCTIHSLFPYPANPWLFETSVIHGESAWASADHRSLPRDRPSQRPITSARALEGSLAAIGRKAQPMTENQETRAPPIEEETGWAVVSIGLGDHREQGRETYDALLDLLPHSLVALLLVDVRPSLPAPEKSKRPRGKFPDPGVVMGVRQSRGFERVLAECRAKLQYNGIVYIGCNKANHRAPTVAAELSRESGCYVVHAGLSNVTAKDIATLTWACFQNRMNLPNYSLDVARYFAEMREPPELTLGWDWRGFEGCQPFQHCRAVIPIMRKGTVLSLLGTLEQHTPAGAEHPFTCAVLRRPNDTEPCHRLIIMPLNYLLPERIYRLSALWRQRGDETMEHVSTEFRGDAGTHRGATPSALESTR